MLLEILFFLNSLKVVDFSLQITGNSWPSWLPAVPQRWLCRSASGWLHSARPAPRCERRDQARHCAQRTLATLPHTTVGFLLFSVTSAKAITCPSCKNIYEVYARSPQRGSCVARLLRRPLCPRPALCCTGSQPAPAALPLSFQIPL